MAALQALEGALLAFSTHEDGGSAEFGRIAGALAELDGKFAARELVEAGGAAAQHDEGAASAGHGELLRLQRRWQMAKCAAAPRRHRALSSCARAAVYKARCRKALRERSEPASLRSGSRRRATLG